MNENPNELTLEERVFRLELRVELLERAIEELYEAPGDGWFGRLLRFFGITGPRRGSRLKDKPAYK